MKNLFAILICIALCGCAMSQVIPTHIGMTKQELLFRANNPISWNRQVINNKTYESLNYGQWIGNFDFVDDILVGYSNREPFGDLKYHTR